MLNSACWPNLSLCGRAMSKGLPSLAGCKNPALSSTSEPWLVFSLIRGQKFISFPQYYVIRTFSGLTTNTTKIMFKKKKRKKPYFLFWACNIRGKVGFPHQKDLLLWFIYEISAGGKLNGMRWHKKPNMFRWAGCSMDPEEKNIHLEDQLFLKFFCSWIILSIIV